jgi:hypothetical protein
VRVRYKTAAGKEIDETRSIKVKANDWWKVDFTVPPPSKVEEEKKVLPKPKSDDLEIEVP